MFSEKDFFTEVMFFEEYEKDEKAEKIVFFIKNNKNFVISILNENHYKTFNLDYDFLKFIKKLYYVLNWDSNFKKDVVKEQYEKIKEINERLFNILIEKIQKDNNLSEKNTFALIEFVDYRKNISFNILEVSNDFLNLVNKVIKNSELVLKEKTEYVYIENSLVFFWIPGYVETYCIVKVN